MITDSYVKNYLLENHNYCKLVHDKPIKEIQEIKEYLSKRFYNTNVINAWFRIYNSYIGYCPINLSMNCKSIEEYNQKDKEYQSNKK